MYIGVCVVCVLCLIPRDARLVFGVAMQLALSRGKSIRIVCVFYRSTALKCKGLKSVVDSCFS